MVKWGTGQGQGASDRWDAGISTVSPSFTISDNTSEEWPLLPFWVWFTPLSPLTLNLSLSHLSFSSTVIFPSLWPNYFCLCCAPLALPLQLSLYIERNFPSSFHISFYALIPPHAQGLISLECSLACLFLPSPRTTALRPLCVSQKPECLPTDKLQLHLIINIVGESEVQVGDTARTRWMR